MRKSGRGYGCICEFILLPFVMAQEFKELVF